MSELALETATVIRAGFISYQAQFKSLTRRAQRCFEQREWRRNQAIAVQRLDLYSEIVSRTITDVHRLQEEAVQDRPLWERIKWHYAHQVSGWDDAELAETFFNSITRRIFTTVGVDPDIEFIQSKVLPEPPPGPDISPICRAYARAEFASLSDLIQLLLADARLEAGFACLSEDAARVAQRIEGALPGQVERIDVVDTLFFRGKAAYLVGRVLSAPSGEILPLVMALRHAEDGVRVDALVLTEDETSIIFSFAHTYFHVDINRPAALVSFLKSILPRKPVSDLWNSIGFNRHGKTVLYRELLHHLAHSEDHLVLAEGTPGMVMIVFTLPSYEMVFKIIKDQFDYPKQSTRKDVMASYRLVFRHDRAGRLLDAQSFEYLEFERGRFDPDLLELLQREASQSVTVTGDRVVINFLYTERRVTPLNLYLARVDGDARRAAVREYGQAIRDLANTNIFPGDLFLKNFGVTRHGRVLFYDYDELCFVTDCQFRRIPPAPSWEDELSDQPWYPVGPRDVFPEQFVHFLGLPRELKAEFLDAHGDLLKFTYWQQIKQAHEDGHLPDIFPYQSERRLK